jgi:hypothetical protein
MTSTTLLGLGMTDTDQVAWEQTDYRYPFVDQSSQKMMWETAAAASKLPHNDSLMSPHCWCMSVLD